MTPALLFVKDKASYTCDGLGKDYFVTGVRRGSLGFINGPSGFVRVRRGLSGFIGVRQGLSGFVELCQGSSGFYRVRPLPQVGTSKQIIAQCISRSESRLIT